LIYTKQISGTGLLPQAAYNGTIISGGGSGSSSPSYISDPYSAFQQAAIMKNFELYWDFQSAAPTVDAASDACVVFINAYAS
jgi:beta-glucosidase